MFGKDVRTNTKYKNYYIKITTEANHFANMIILIKKIFNKIK